MPPKGSIKGVKLKGFMALSGKKGVAASTTSAGALAQALSPSTASALTPAAAKLTKSDLVALNADPKGETAKLGLSATDISSVKKAFSTVRMATKANAKGEIILDGGGCACCCPCCCATSVPVEAAVR